ncbi:hypothetical protein BC835DRAFT_1310064 [Cytidiella melzeri]|nr:hypothetical protein BC835DRAFT_1310064 [Cytidiella melzeri]
MCWTPATPQYMAAIKYIKERKYHRALNKLQKLVTQRLFELHKLNVAQTGYKMRTHIAKSLQTCCKTIQRAIKTYNAAAAMLDPPRPALDWSRVSTFNFLEEFTLLQDTHNDIRDKEWSKPAIREAMKLRHRLARAQEERDRLNVEVRRLHTAIRDEALLFSQVLRRLKSSNNSLLGATSDFVTRRTKGNNHLRARIQQVYALEGYTSVKAPGTRLGGALHVQAGELPGGLLAMPDQPKEPSDNVEEDDAHDDLDLLEDEEQASMDGLVHFLSELAL